MTTSKDTTSFELFFMDKWWIMDKLVFQYQGNSHPKWVGHCTENQHDFWDTSRYKGCQWTGGTM